MNELEKLASAGKDHAPETTTSASNSIDDRLDQLFDMIAGIGTANELANKEHDLKEHLSKEELELKKNDSKFRIESQDKVILLSIIYLGFMAFTLLTLIFCKQVNLFNSNSWHVSVALIVGLFLSLFGVMALLLKGVFKQPEDGVLNSATPESFKAVIDACKVLGGAKN